MPSHVVTIGFSQHRVRRTTQASRRRFAETRILLTQVHRSTNHTASSAAAFRVRCHGSAYLTRTVVQATLKTLSSLSNQRKAATMSLPIFPSQTAPVANGLSLQRCGARTNSRRLRKARLLTILSAVASAVGVVGAAPARAITPQCYFSYLEANCHNLAYSPTYGAQGGGYMSPPVFAGNSSQSFYNNASTGTNKRQLFWLRSGPNSYQFWFAVNINQAGRLWYYPYTSSSYVLAKCQNLSAGTITAQCGSELNTSYAWVYYPN